MKRERGDEDQQVPSSSFGLGPGPANITTNQLTYLFPSLPLLVLLPGIHPLLHLIIHITLASPNE